MVNDDRIRIADPYEAIEDLIELHEPSPWDREMLRQLLEEAMTAEHGRASFWRLVIDLVNKIEKGVADGDDDAFSKALEEARDSLTA